MLFYTYFWQNSYKIWPLEVIQSFDRKYLHSYGIHIIHTCSFTTKFCDIHMKIMIFKESISLLWDSCSTNFDWICSVTTYSQAYVTPYSKMPVKSWFLKIWYTFRIVVEKKSKNMFIQKSTYKMQHKIKTHKFLNRCFAFHTLLFDELMISI